MQLQRWKMFAGTSLAIISLAVPALVAETKGPVTDDIGVVVIQPGDPIVIANYAATTGTDFTAGIYEQNGAKIAVEDRGGEVAGHPIQLITEDAPCTPEGGQNGATKLISTTDLLAVSGPSCSSSAAVGAPILWNVGIPSVGTGPSATNLTAPDRPASSRAASHCWPIQPAPRRVGSSALA